MLDRVFLGRYEPVRLLGEGGMGRVYLAKDTELGRQVVVKVMHDHIAADEKFRERFTRETLLMARFQHPFAVTLYDASLNDPQGPCIVMEYIRGVTLEELLRTDIRLEPARVRRLLGMLCEVLQAAHGEGIVHRDLKPANLMIVDPGTAYELIKVMDFGLAKLLARDATIHNPTVTNAEFAVGTPGYMCPEQARGEDMDCRGDIYSVGVILFELLTGRLPFAGRATMDVLLAHATEEPPPFAALNASNKVPVAIEQLVMACLAKDPGRRPASARELFERYQAALGEPAAAVPEPTPPPIVALRPSFHSRSPAPEVPSASPPDPPPVDDHDPHAIVHYLEAWMPEKIATFKVRGFIQDAGGEVVESVPGRIRVRLGGKGSPYSAPRRGPLAWLGLDPRAGQINMELRLQRPDEGRDSQLRVTVLLWPAVGDLSTDDIWQSMCRQIFCDLRGYLMGQSAAVRSDATL